METLTRHFMVQLENFVSKDSKDMVSKLKKSMYGLKQESRQWYFKIHQVIIVTPYLLFNYFWLSLESFI